MMYMIYSEWDANEACIVNFIEGKENAIIWANHFYYQYLDSTPDYIDFHWQDFPIKLAYTRNRVFTFHPEPVFLFSNGIDSVIAVPLDHEFSVDEIKQIPKFDARIFPWIELIDNQYDSEYLIHLLKNKKN